MDVEQISADGIPLNLADTQARTDITEIKSNLTDKYATLTFNSISGNAYNEQDYPTGFTQSNCVVISFMFKQTDNNWYGGQGAGNTIFTRCFYRLSSTKVAVYTTDANIASRDVKLVLMRTDI